ncbi:MAG: hypothetical protein KKA73_06605 [Chloroflexi bacterium]|nr:hypothetical protein [Chloroflexota bacterium]MBU1747342.1 hypothetical protein [Chloroflexota bacterium]
MSDHPIPADSAPAITDEEARRRLGQVYRLLLDLVRQKRAAAAGQAQSEPPAEPEPET